jgi:hypothetical protein
MPDNGGNNGGFAIIKMATTEISTVLRQRLKQTLEMLNFGEGESEMIIVLSSTARPHTFIADATCLTTHAKELRHAVLHRSGGQRMCLAADVDPLVIL